MLLIRLLYEANFVRLLRSFVQKLFATKRLSLSATPKSSHKILNFFPLRYENKFPIFSKHSRVSCFTSSIQCQYQRIISTPKAFSIEFAEATQGSGIKDYRYPDGKLSEAHLEIVFQVTLLRRCIVYVSILSHSKLVSTAKGEEFNSRDLLRRGFVSIWGQA